MPATTELGPTAEADLAATGEAEAEVVGVVPFKGLAAVLVASFTSWNFSMNCKMTN